MYLGDVDGTHISIQPLLGAKSDYFNHKKHHSIIMLTVVKSMLKFTNVNVGGSGRCNDASVYNRSLLDEVIQHSINGWTGAQLHR